MMPWVMLCVLLGLTVNVWAEDTGKPAPLPAKQPARIINSEVKPAGKPAANAPVDKPASQRGNDQLTLDATVVTGNRELPKVMYIVPWKKAELSNLPGQPFNTLIDEALAPVDREVFRREVAYYDVVADKDHAGIKAVVAAQATSAADSK
jgi:hypothetical protein